jgi:hypothetical protein
LGSSFQNDAFEWLARLPPQSQLRNTVWGRRSRGDLQDQIRAGYSPGTSTAPTHHPIPPLDEDRKT